MKRRELHHTLKKLRTALLGTIYAILILMLLTIYMLQPLISGGNTIEENGKMVSTETSEIQSELVVGNGRALVVQHCIACHSEKLIIQNRGDEKYWRSVIRWMQQTQNLWELGKSEEVIVEYLSTHYGPIHKGRRQTLTSIEWHPIQPEYN